MYDESMKINEIEKIKIIVGDITRVHCDAIVNAANNSLLGGGGVDGAIHRAAGKQLLEECKTIGGCNTGDCKLTRGYNLPADYVIHTVGPIYRDGKHGEPQALASCYDKALAMAAKMNLKSIAFPSISTGAYGYPIQEAATIALTQIVRFIEENQDDYPSVLIVCFFERVKTVYEDIYKNLL